MLPALVFAAFLLQASPPQDPTSPAPPSPPSTQSESGILTFHVTAREVLLDLIALDPRGRPILDLKPSDLQVSELPAAPPQPPGKRHKHRSRQRPEPTPPAETEPIAGLRIVDPDAPQSSAAAPGGFRIAASCLERSTLHYQLAFHPGPDGSASGYHQVVVTTTRRGARLHYPHHYYIGLAAPPAQPPLRRTSDIDNLLQQAACYYPETPPSIALRARRIDTGSTDILRYAVFVDAGSLSFLTLSDAPASHKALSLDRRVQLDYGVCNFDASGHPIDFFHAPVDQVLTSVDYARALAHGFPHTLEFPAPRFIALTRFVVRDRATGNLGATDLQFPFPDLPSPAAPEIVASTHSLAAETAADLALYGTFSHGAWVRPPHGPIGSFGSIVPSPGSLCGDVFELDQPSDRLPDFRELDPIGSVYTSTLDVPSQIFVNTSGIPGVTPRTNLFGIDYHGVFWIKTPGDYQFRMESDDGAYLSIDDTQLIDLDGLHSALGKTARIHLDAGRHTLHIPWYQGQVDSVALLLWIQSPGQDDWSLFDLRNFAPPPAGSAPSAAPAH